MENLTVRKVKCNHCDGTGRVEEHIWVILFMANGTKECWDCAGKGYQLMTGGIRYKDYTGEYEKHEIENEYEQLYKRS